MRNIVRAVSVALVLTAACTVPPEVVQGTVISYDAAKEVMTISDDSPSGRHLTLSLQNAEIGADPAPGDTVRVAYREQNGELAATRVMNVTRQSH